MATEQEIIDFLQQPPTGEIGKAFASPEGKELFKRMKAVIEEGRPNSIGELLRRKDGEPSAQGD